jgi:5-methylcytosine-specific restriction enzyme subunit McrC
VRIKPDLVWRDQNGGPLAVIDAKYKAEKPAGFPDADLYQMLAYCIALNLTEGHLVFAKGNESPLTHVVRNTGIAIRCHALDLARRPNELLDQIGVLAANIAVGVSD